MNWNDRLLSADELTAFIRTPEGETTNTLARALLRQQLETWPMLREATAALSQAEYKEFSIKGSKVLAQFNPARIVSTSAKVDATTISQRPCFLCADNLPPEEKGIPFGDRFVILCNPFPVLADHLVISAREHTPQVIDGNFGAMLDLARELGEDWFVLYNGPRCGASAPDHFHFQACARAGVPLFKEVETSGTDFSLSSDPGQTNVRPTFRSQNYRFNLMAFAGTDWQQLESWFTRATSELAAVTNSDAEPMLNLLLTYQADHWRGFILPRGKHRPARYFAEDDAKLTISPAAIDLAGVVVVPQPDHFARITAEDLEAIFVEVGLSDEQMRDWLRQVNHNEEVRH